MKQENAALKIQHEKDISERVIAEETLTNEKNLLRSLMNNMPDKIYFKDFKNRFIRISKSQAILFGLNDPEQAYGKTDFDFFTEEHAHIAFETELEIMKTGRSVVDLEEKETWPNGKETWVSTTKVPLRDNNGNIIGTFGISRDITERKSMEKSLIESEIKFRKTFDFAPVGIVLAGLDQRFLHCNEAFTESLGYSETELIGKTIQEITYPEDKNIGMPDIAAMINGEIDSSNVQKRYLRKDREVIWGEVTISLIKSFEGSPQYFIAIIIQDVTKRKEIERKLEIYQSSLKALVEERTSELDKVNASLKMEIEKDKEFELMLQQSLEKEKELNEIKSRFISTTSHEFRTPLAAVLSSTELLQRYGAKWNDDKKNEHFSRIYNSVEYLINLLDDVLTISRTETGKISFNPESVNLFQLVSECEKDTKSLLTEKHEMIFDFVTDDKEFQLDRKLMKFIFNNLLSNAVKYSPDGGKIGLTINTNKQHLIIEISDEGIGIPPETVDKIFDSFYRSKNTGMVAGTGLGLAIVKRSVDLHNGEVTVNSELNKGTTFTVKIPLNVA